VSGLAAFLFNIGGEEMFVLMIIGVVLFGRNLPEVGRTLGKTVAQLRRGFQDFKDQMDRDDTLRDVRKTMSDVKRAVDVPRAIVDPGRMLQNLTNEALYSPPPEEPTAGGEPAPPAQPTQAGPV
jgi:sec-independent protein translocase protein TatA